MKFRSRLTGEITRLPDSLSISGLWQSAGPALTAGHAALEEGDVLIADEDGWLELSAEDGRNRLRLDWRSQALTRLAILQLEQFTVQTDRLKGRPFAEWQQSSPLHEALRTQVTLNPLDREIQRNLRHLEHVARDPVSRLEYVEMHLPSERVRRLSGRAITHLASHSEDWLNQTLRGVRPRSLLALERDDELEIYENLVAARLLDHLETYLKERIEEVSSISDHISAALRNFQDQAQKGTHRRKSRLYRLWARAMSRPSADPSRSEETEEKTTAEKTLEELRVLHRRVVACKAQRLYRGVSRAPVARTLKLTNILRSDKHYRFVAHLWRVWTLGTKGTESASQKRERLRRTVSTWNAFVLMMTARGLADCGYSSESTEPVEPGTTHLLRSDTGDEITLHYSTSGTQEIRRGGKLLLHVVPVAAYLDPGLLPPRGRTTDCLVALSPEGGKHHPRVHILENRNMPYAEVSPMRLDSSEVYGRLIAKAVLETAYLAYPPVFRPLGGPPPRFVSADREQWYLMQLPTQHEPLNHELLRREWLKHGRAQRKKRSDEILLDGFNQAVESFASARKDLSRILTCPFCRRETGQIELRADRTFQATCTCGEGVWGVRQCVKGHRYGVFLPMADTGTAPRSEEEAEAVYGLEMMALPVDPQGKRFLCPECAQESMRRTS